MAISYISTFDYNNQELVITDTRDYAGEGLAAGVGIFKITDPLGNVIYENAGFATDSFASGDVIFGTSNTFSTALPLSGGVIIEGIYTVIMKNQVTGPVETSLTQTYNYANPTVTQDVDVTINVDVPSILVEDSTAYGSGASLTRAWTVYYPSSLGLSNVTGTAGSILLQAPTDVYTGSYQAKLVTTVSYTVGANAALGTTTHIMSAVFTTTKAFTVDNSTLCAGYACVLAMENHYQSLLTTDVNDAADFKPRLDHAIRLMNLIMAGMKCGEDVTTLYATLKGVYDNCSCSADCACDPTTDDTPTLIAPTCPDLTNTVVVAGSGISVSSATAGSTTTYTVSEAAASTTSVTVDTDTTDELTVTDNSVGQAWDFTITHAAPDPWVEVSSFTTGDFAAVSTEVYIGGTFGPMRYRTERKYVRSDGRNAALVRIEGSMRINRTTGAFLIDDMFTLPGTSGTRYRPQYIVSATAALLTGVEGIIPLSVLILDDGRVLIEDDLDLSTLTPYDTPTNTYFMLNLSVTFEGVEPIP